jgi:site-specific recombinase XerD
MRELLQDYLTELKVLGRSEKTVTVVEFWLQGFERFCLEQGLSLAQLTSSTIETYRTRLLWQPQRGGRLYAPHSVALGLRQVRSFMRWAVAKGALRSDPTRDLVLSNPKSRPRRVWSAAEQETLLSEIEPATPMGLRDRALFMLAFNTSLTRNQLSGLDVADFDSHTYQLKAERGRRRCGPGELVLPDALAQPLCRYLIEGRPGLNLASNEPALFLSRNGRRLNNHRIGQILLGPARPFFLNRRP